MRPTKEALSIRVVIRRVERSATPFSWEVYSEERADPLYVSSERFGNMEAACQAGQARLTEFIPQRSMPPGVTENRCWQSRSFGLSNSAAAENPDSVLPGSDRLPYGVRLGFEHLRHVIPSRGDYLNP